MKHTDYMIKSRKDWPIEFTDFEKRSFKEITKSFKVKLQKLVDKDNRVSVFENFTKKRVGEKTSQKQLAKFFPQNKIKNQYQGIYLFFYKEEPFYAGISKNIIKRVRQHVMGNTHFTSSLCYSMGKQLYLEQEGKPHEGGRKGLDFETYSKPYRKILGKECKIAMLAIESPVELYLFECYAAIELKTLFYNRFETH